MTPRRHATCSTRSRVVSAKKQKLSEFGVPEFAPVVLRAKNTYYLNRPAIHVGSWRISIQASRAHYCDPREDGLPIDDYNAVEVGIFDADNPGRGFLGPEDLPWVPREMAAGYAEPGGPLSYVPVRALVEFLRSLLH